MAPGIPTIIPPRPPQPGFMMPQPQLGQKRPGVPVVEEESSGKKAKTEEQLIPEDVFLQSNKVSSNIAKHLSGLIVDS